MHQTFPSNIQRSKRSPKRRKQPRHTHKTQESERQWCGEQLSTHHHHISTTRMKETNKGRSKTPTHNCGANRSKEDHTQHTHATRRRRPQWNSQQQNRQPLNTGSHPRIRRGHTHNTQNKENGHDTQNEEQDTTKAIETHTDIPDTTHQTRRPEPDTNIHQIPQPPLPTGEPTHQNPPSGNRPDIIQDVYHVAHM